MMRRGGVVMLAEGEEARGRRCGTSWADTNLTAPKNEENLRGRFNCYKWTMKILSINELI
jgi:hypothetical protein